MTTTLPKLNTSRKTGAEPFHSNGVNVGYDLKSFWQWSVSDLVSNTTRGRLAEYLVAQALGLADGNVGNDWAPYDLETESGLKIEVKSAAYIQSWYQNKLSIISFVVPKTREWDSVTNILSNEPKRQADIYVFALLAHKHKNTIDPMNIDQWQFYLLPTKALNSRTRSQHSITIKSLEKLCSSPVKYSGLHRAIRAIEKDIMKSG